MPSSIGSSSADGRRSAPVFHAFPDRRAYGWIAAGAIVFAIYGSLVPFDFHQVPLGQARDLFRELLFTPPDRRISRSNVLANLLLFVPIGFGLMGRLLADRRARWLAVPAALATLVASASVSLLAEFLQIFAADRVPSRVDVGAQIIGSAIGVTGWILAGPALTGWLRATRSSGPSDRLTRTLVVYTAAWVFVNLAPFDITVDPGHLARRLREGSITLVPYGHLALTGWRIAWDAFATTVTAVPLGVFGLVGGMGPGRRRPAMAAFAVGTLAVLCIEVAQVFIRSHAADTGDLLCGVLGVGLGVRAGLWILRRPGAPGDAIVLPGQPWAVAALAAWCLIIVAYHWMPYDFAFDLEAAGRKLAAASFIPFSGYWSGSYLNALNDLLVKLAVSMPLGLGAAVAFARSGELSRPAILAVVAAAGLLFGIVEAGQLFVASRVPEPTDVLIGTTGAALGLWAGRWLIRGS